MCPREVRHSQTRHLKMAHRSCIRLPIATTRLPHTHSTHIAATAMTLGTEVLFESRARLLSSE